MPPSDKAIEIYSWGTPNGQKIHILCEELEIEWKLNPIDIARGDQFQAHFLAISPNNKIPAMVDPQGPNHAPLSLFESGAILLYLAEKHQKFLGENSTDRWHILQWLMFQVGGVGPMLGQNHHFRLYAPEPIEYAINRYTKEAQRLYGVIDKQLSRHAFLAGEYYSIADIALFPWLRSWDKQGVQMGDYPALAAWFDKISQRPAVQKGLKAL